jgi:hypothetical protein
MIETGLVCLGSWLISLALKPCPLLFSAKSAESLGENYSIPIFIAKSCLHPVNKLFLLFK